MREFKDFIIKMTEIKKMNHVLVTGGAGFIGAYLVKRLIDMNVRVTIVDNLQDVGGISYVHPKANFINADICDTSLYLQLKKLNIDTVYHLAAQSAGEPAYDDPKFDILTNSYGTYLIAKFCKDNNVARLIYTSTVAVYGNSIDGILDENSKISPDSIYGVSKYSGEMFIKQMLHNSQTKYTIFRVFNTYGPGEFYHPYRSVNCKFCYHALFGFPITVYRGHFRSSTYVDDCVRTVGNISDNFKAGAVYNIGSSQFHDIETLADIIWNYTGADRKLIEYGESEKLTTKIKKLDNSLSIKDLNHIETVSLEEGVRKTIDWAHIGPANSIVDNVEIHNEKFITEFSKFDILY